MVWEILLQLPYAVKKFVNENSIAFASTRNAALLSYTKTVLAVRRRVDLNRLRMYAFSLDFCVRIEKYSSTS